MKAALLVSAGAVVCALLTTAASSQRDQDRARAELASGGLIQ
jgi:hypothetical protein